MLLFFICSGRSCLPCYAEEALRLCHAKPHWRKRTKMTVALHHAQTPNRPPDSLHAKTKCWAWKSSSQKCYSFTQNTACIFMRINSPQNELKPGWMNIYARTMEKTSHLYKKFAFRSKNLSLSFWNYSLSFSILFVTLGKLTERFPQNSFFEAA